MIVWKQPDRIISAGLGMIRKDKRMKLLGHRDGVNLQITNLDIGEPILHTNQLKILGTINPLLILFAPLFSANLPPS